MQRRSVLRTLGAAIPVGVAGCSGKQSRDSNGGTPEENSTTNDETHSGRLVVPDLDPSEFDSDTLGITWTTARQMTTFRETDHILDHYIEPNRMDEWKKDMYAISGLDGSFTLIANSPGASAHQRKIEKDEPERTYEGFDLYEGPESWVGIKDSTIVDLTPSKKLSLEPPVAIERIIDAWEGDGIALESARSEVKTLLEAVDAGEFLHLEIGFPDAFQETTGPAQPADATTGLLGIDVEDGSATVSAAAAYPSDPSLSEFETALMKKSSATRQLPFQNPSVSRDESTLTATSSHDLIRARTNEGKLNFVDSDYVLDVTGSQYEWTFTHPDGSSEVDEVTVPGDQPIGFRFESADVFHGFALPVFRINVEVSPKKETRALIELPEPGTHSFLCNEYCGPGHSEHLGKLIIE